MCNVKHQLRSDIRQWKRGYSQEILKQYSLELCQQLEKHPRFQQAGTVLLYAALHDEVHTQYLLDKWYQQKQILLPQTHQDTLTLHPYHGKESMHTGAFHILEPHTPAFEDYAAIDVAIIPGMAFTADGKRLGRGKGYYDRLLSMPPMQQVYKMGLAFPFQMVRNIPTDKWDVSMDEVLSLGQYSDGIEC